MTLELPPGPKRTATRQQTLEEALEGWRTEFQIGPVAFTALLTLLQNHWANHLPVMTEEDIEF